MGIWVFVFLPCQKLVLSFYERSKDGKGSMFKLKIVCQFNLEEKSPRMSVKLGIVIVFSSVSFLKKFSGLSK